MGDRASESNGSLLLAIDLFIKNDWKVASIVIRYSDRAPKRINIGLIIHVNTIPASKVTSGPTLTGEAYHRVIICR